MKIAIPEFCLIAVVAANAMEGAAFTRRYFAPGEVVNRESEAWPAAAADRLSRRELIVVDMSETAQQEQSEILRLAKRFHAQPVAVVLPSQSGHPDLKMVRRLEETGFRPAHVVSARDADGLVIERVRLPPDLRHEHGPFDIVGDIHGCADELAGLLGRLGYRVSLKGSGDERRANVDAPAGRRVIFVGDFVDRGPRSPDVLRIVMRMVEQGHAMAVPGNHDVKFLKWLRGANVRLTHGLDRTVAQFAHESGDFHGAVREFLAGLPSHLWLENGRLVVAHAGIVQEMIGRESDVVRQFCLYGDTDGETDETGLVVRYHWAAAYRGEAAIVYGHTPVPDAEWVNNTLCIDTGCCFGGTLTALRWPEREVISVPAAMMYAQPGRPFGHPPARPVERPQPRQGRRAGYR